MTSDKTLVIDASVAVKWVVDEEGTSAALALRGHAELIAPEEWVAECANILWKKVQRSELSSDEAAVAARLLERADVDLVPTRRLLDASLQIAIALDRPAYDAVYLALAMARDCRFVTADERLIRKIARSRHAGLRGRAIALQDRAAFENGSAPTQATPGSDS